MNRQERLKWIKLSQELNDNMPDQIVCPNDDRHSLEVRIIDYPEYLKREQTLICNKCNIKLTFTISIVAPGSS